MQRIDSLEKTLMLGKVEGRRRRRWQRMRWMVGWHHWLTGYEFEQSPGVADGQGSLAYCRLWSHKELDTTEWLNWTELSYHIFPCVCVCVCVCACVLSRVQLFSTLWTIAHQAPLSMDFLARTLEQRAISCFRGLPDPGMQPRSPALPADSLSSQHSRRINIFPNIYIILCLVLVCFFGDQPTKLNLSSDW